MPAGKEIQFIKVECYSGYRADEKPVSFILDDRKIMIERIIEQWRSPDYEYFKVQAGDGKGYLLAHNSIKDGWEIQSCL